MLYCGRTLIYGCLFLFLLSCSVQQRRYRPGLAINWIQGKGQADEKHSDEQRRGRTLVQSSVIQTISPIASQAEALILQKKPLTAVTSGANKEDSCDVILFRDGSEVRARVISYLDGKVRYYRCDMEDGPVFVVPGSKLSMIKYADGHRRVFEKEIEPKEKSGESSRTDERTYARERHPSAGTALILSVAGVLTIWFGLGIAFLIASMGLAIRALNDNKRTPGRYSNMDMVRVALAIDIFFLGLILLGLVLVLYVLLFL